MSNRGRHLFVALIAFVVAFSMVAPAIAATSDDPVTDHLNLGAWDEEDTAPNPVINASVTTSAQDLSQGRTHDDIAGYEDDNGNWVSGNETPFVVNTSHDISSGRNVNPYSFKPGHIEDSSYTAFPDKADRTWSNASGWSTVTNGANVTISNTTVATNVDAVQFDTGTSGNTVSNGQTVFEAAYSRWDGELDSDETKRVLQFAADVDTLEANAEVHVRLYDESADYKQFVMNGSRNFDTNNTVLANGTNDFVKQVKLSDISTQGGGSFDNIENVTVEVISRGTTNADATFSISWLDLRKKTKNDLGEKRATTDDSGNDADSDGDFDEFQTIHNSTNDVDVYSMETLDSEYDDAVITDLTYPARYQADGLDSQGQEGTYVFSFEDPENPGFATKLNVTYSLELPGVVDLSYSQTKVKMIQKWSDSRYLTLEQASEVSESTNLSHASFSSVSTTSKGSAVTIQSSSVDAGERFIVHYVVELDGEEENAVKVDGGGAAPPEEEARGGVLQGITDFVTNPLGAIITLALGFVGFRWWRAR